MKKITFILSLVSLSLTVAASAAVQSNDQEIVSLANYDVRADRYTSAEMSIGQSLAAFRAEARRAVTPIATDLPSLNQTVAPAQPQAAHEIAVKPALRVKPAARS